MTVFSEERADDAQRFFERVLVHCDGEWAGQPFTLLPWQRDDLIRPLFGTLLDDSETRQYRTCYVEVPRKNGKSQIAAGIALYLLFADGEPGAQIYGAAGDRDQATIVYRVASEMVRRSSILAGRAKVLDSTKRIIAPGSASFYRAIPADAAGSHGFNAHGVIVDEVHVQPNRDLIDVLNTSTGARRQPLTFYITTAGYDVHSICYELHDYALKVKAGVIDDPTFLPVVYSANESDDWTDPAVWRKANPSLGETVKEEYIARECKRAQETPAYENTFRRLHLNQWVRQETRWLPLAAWDACGADVDIEALAGRPCYGGLDLSSTTDISALVLAFPGEDGVIDLLSWYWIPGENIEEREKRDKVPYGVWARQGLVCPTEGNVIDYAYIRQTVNNLAATFNIREIAYDPWNATQLSLNLVDDGIEMIPMRQGYASMSAPTKELLNLVLAQKIRHGGHPVLRFMADSCVVTMDPAGNIKPDKAKSTARIDGIVATIMAVDRCTRNQGGSVYEDRGLLVL